MPITHAALAATALALAACTTGTTAVDGGPPVGHVAISQLPEQPAHEPDLPLDQPSRPMDRSDPAAVAAALVVAGLAEQGLEVVDLGVQTLPATADGITVRVAATHRPGQGAPHTSVYELDLTRVGGPGGSWRLAGSRQAQ